MFDIFKKVGDALGGVVGAVFTGIDKIDTSEEEKLMLRTEILRVEAEARMELAELAGQIEQERAKVIRAEIASDSWLAKSWRPIVMLTFAFVVLYATIGPSFGAPPVNMDGLPTPFWRLLTVGIGGYVGARTLEKVIPNSKWGKDYTDVS